MRLVDGATNPTYWLLNDHPLRSGQASGSTAITASPPPSPKKSPPSIPCFILPTGVKLEHMY